MDHTKGEVKSVRGSGPPILTVERDAVHIGIRAYLVDMGFYSREGRLAKAEKWDANDEETGD